MKIKLVSLLLVVSIYLSFALPTALSQGNQVTGSFSYYVTLHDEDGAAIYQYDDTFFAQSSYHYNHKLAIMSLGLAMSAFNAKGAEDSDYAADIAGGNVKSLLHDLGFTNIDIERYAGKPKMDGIGFALGEKQLSNNTTLIAVAIRGGGYELEWISNFEMSGNSTDHVGFASARDQVLQGLKQYVQSQNIQGEVKIWITGYSRAAAVSNLLGAAITDGACADLQGVSIQPVNVFTYTFATPNTTKCAPRDDVQYQNIFNWIHPEDIVTKVPLSEWGYARYGVDYTIPKAGSDRYNADSNDVLKTYNELSGTEVSSLSFLKLPSWSSDIITQQLSTWLETEDSKRAQRTLAAIRMGIAIGSLFDNRQLEGLVTENAKDIVVAHAPNLYLAWLETLAPTET